MKNIKKSVENAVGENIQEDELSLVLATLTSGLVYIVIANSGKVILKRDEKLGVVAEGERGTITSFSGKLLSSDILILETSDFSQKVPIKKLSEILDMLSVSEISETLAPLIHEESKGTEAAIVIEYNSTAVATAIETQQEREIDTEGAAPEGSARREKAPSPYLGLKNMIKIPNIPFSLNFSTFSRKKIIGIAIVLLLILLAASILFERQRQEGASRAKLLSEILTPAETKFDEAQALVALNRSLALEEFETVKKTLDESRAKFREGTSERKELDEFIGKVEGRIGELGAGSSVANQKVIFENVDFIMFREGIVVSDKNGKITLLSASGKSEKEIDSKNNNVKAVTADKNAVYLVGEEGITRSTKTSGSTKAIVDKAQIISIDIFGTNVYGLNQDKKTIDKYSGSSYSKSDYLTEGITLNDPVSMAIDGSIWIIDDGKVRKFTRGKEDNFSLSGVSGKISQNSQIFTSVDYSNIYILDKDATKIISISKDGEVKNQYAWKELSRSSSFAVDEEGEKVYVIIDQTLHSFDL